MSAFSDGVLEHAADLTAGSPASADGICRAWRCVPGYRGGRWWLAAASGGCVERYRRTGAEQEALKLRAGSSWSSRGAGTTGITGLRDSDDDDTGTGRPAPESDGP